MIAEYISIVSNLFSMTIFHKKTVTISFMNKLQAKISKT